MTEIIGGVALIVGATLVALAGLGVVRFRDVFNRMHASTKASTLGILMIATGSSVRLGEWLGVVKLLVAVFVIFITAPIAAHLVTRAAYPDWKANQQVGGHDDLAARPGRSLGD